MSPAFAAKPQIAVVLESAGLTVNLPDSPDLDGFVAAANARARIRGLDDALNPAIIDAEKLGAMVATLPGQSEDVLAALAGHTLPVALPGLGVLAVEPTAAGAFGAGYRLRLDRLAGVHVLVTSNVATDPGVARTRAAAAEAATNAADKAVRAAEAGQPDPDGMSTGDLRWRRAQAARAWHIVVNAWKRAVPDDEAAEQAWRKADAAVRVYDMPSGALP